MISLHNILTVAKYEAKILRRSWLFRLFVLGALFNLTIMNIAIFSPIGDEDWAFLGIPSSIPYLNLYLLNIGQALVIVFLASDFLKKDKKLDTNEVLYTRSISNLEYIAGKSWGIIRLFLWVNIIVLAEALLINLIAKNTFVDIGSYFYFLLIISVPTIIFSLGLAYLLMSIIKNQAITFLLLLGYAALDMFYLYFRAGSIFDYMLFGMPVFKSEIIGFDDIGQLLLHRGLYTMLGLGFIFFTVLTFKRLPQSRSHRIVSSLMLAALLAGSSWAANSLLKDYYEGLDMRAQTLEINRKFEEARFLSVYRADLTINHKGKTLEGIASMACKNNLDTDIDEFVFSLNPELKLSKVLLDGEDISYKREGHIIDIKAGKDILQGDSILLDFYYSGTLNEEYCYPWYEGNIKDNELRIGPVPVNQRQVLLYKDYALLTPDANWYPVATLNYFPSNPARIKVDFTKYNLKVETSDKLTAISQGKYTRDGAYSYFKSENPISGMSLIIGDYKCDSLRIDSILFTAWYKPGNDYFKNDLNEIADTIPLLIKDVMNELEINFKTSYPFKSLNLVEVPVQYRSIDKKNTRSLAEVQPSMILLPERLAIMEDGDFYRTIKRNKKRMERDNQVITDKELQVRAFTNFIRNSFITGGENFNFRNGSFSTETSRYLLGPSYYFFKNNFYSPEYPVMNAVFESHLQKVETANMRRGFLGGLSENDKANNILKGKSLKDILLLDPSNDTLRIVLTVKGDYLFNLIRSQAGMDEFNDWFSKYLEKNKFKNISLDQLNSDLEENFGFSISENIEKWFNDSEQPGFYFTGLTATEIVVDNRTRYLVSFEASNPEAIEGIFTVSFRTMGAGRGAGGMGGGRPGEMGGPGRNLQPAEIDKIVMLQGGQSKKISLILDAQPRAVSFNTLFSMNNPGEIMMPIEEVLENNRAEINEDEVILSKMPPFTEKNEIIVDNEDPGFSFIEPTSSGRLKKWLGISSEDRIDYSEIAPWWAPEYWQKTVQSNYYGMFIKSAHYTRSGAGERTATWTTPIKETGYYDIYAYVQGQRRGPGGPGNMGGNMQASNRGRRGSNQKDLHFTIYHDMESDEVVVDSENATTGWNHLGSYLISGDSASVVLSNKSEGRIVAADAIRWIKQNR